MSRNHQVFVWEGKLEDLQEYIQHKVDKKTRLSDVFLYRTSRRGAYVWSLRRQVCDKLQAALGLELIIHDEFRPAHYRQKPLTLKSAVEMLEAEKMFEGLEGPVTASKTEDPGFDSQ